MSRISRKDGLNKATDAPSAATVELMERFVIVIFGTKRGSGVEMKETISIGYQCSTAQIRDYPWCKVLKIYKSEDISAVYSDFSHERSNFAMEKATFTVNASP